MNSSEQEYRLALRRSTGKFSRAIVHMAFMLIRITESGFLYHGPMQHNA
jgi:hypothetical protein